MEEAKQVSWWFSMVASQAMSCPSIKMRVLVPLHLTQIWLQAILKCVDRDPTVTTNTNVSYVGDNNASSWGTPWLGVMDIG